MTNRRRQADEPRRAKAAATAEIEAELDRRVKEGITREAVEAVMAARGKARIRSKAGSSY